MANNNLHWWDSDPDPLMLIWDDYLTDPELRILGWHVVPADLPFDPPTPTGATVRHLLLFSLLATTALPSAAEAPPIKPKPEGDDDLDPERYFKSTPTAWPDQATVKRHVRPSSEPIREIRYSGGEANRARWTAADAKRARKAKRFAATLPPTTKT